MTYKRIHVRVPISGEALLLSGKGTSIKALAIDISQGGVAITTPDVALTQNTYDIIITIKDGKKIRIAACLVRQDGGLVGFKIDHIDSNSMQIITDLVFEYQESLDFVDQIMEHNLFDHFFVDDEGKQLDITFDVDLQKP